MVLIKGIEGGDYADGSDGLRGGLTPIRIVSL